MNDQAHSLRKLVDHSNSDHAKVIAVVSGKGGVGKSNISLNFAISLARAGKRVAIFDLDLGMANIDILMGVIPKYHLLDLLHEQLTIWDVMEEGPEGISYFAGGTGFSSFVELTNAQMQRFFSQLEQLGPHYDYIIMDMGAGATRMSLEFVLAAHEVFVVTTPEPPAITDAYAQMKHIVIRNENIPLYLIVNRVDSQKEGQKVLNSLIRVSEQFLQKEVNLLGSIPFDSIVTKAVKEQVPFIIMNEKSEVSRAITRLTTKYLGNEDQKPSKFGRFISKVKRIFDNSS